MPTSWRRTCLAAALILALFILLSISTSLITVLRGGVCDGKDWVYSDSGWMDVRRVQGSSVEAVCAGQTWEPHVVEAIGRYLYGQGVALDVGGFAGYHAMRMARLAPTHKVYVFEGREVLHDAILRNARRNNLNNLVMVDAAGASIGDKWKMPEALEQELLEQKKLHPVVMIKVDCEGCELDFLKGSRAIIDEFHPAMVLEIQDDETRRHSKIGGQQIHKPAGTRQEVLDYLRDILKYKVTPLHLKDGEVSWDYEAVWWGELWINEDSILDSTSKK